LGEKIIIKNLKKKNKKKKLKIIIINRNTKKEKLLGFVWLGWVSVFFS